MKIVWLTTLFSDILRLSSPKPRLRHGMQHGGLSLLNLTLKLCILFFVLPLVFLSHLPPLLTSPTVLSPRNRLWFLPTTWNFTYLSPSLRSCAAEFLDTCLSSAEPRILRNLIDLSAPLSPALNFSRLPQTSPRLCHWPRPNCLFLAKAPCSL